MSDLSPVPVSVSHLFWSVLAVHISHSFQRNSGIQANHQKGNPSVWCLEETISTNQITVMKEHNQQLKEKLFLGFFYFLWKILPGLKKERNQIWNKSGLLSSKEISSRSRLNNLLLTFAVKKNLRESTRSFIPTVQLATRQRSCGSSWRTSQSV